MIDSTLQTKMVDLHLIKYNMVNVINEDFICSVNNVQMKQK